MCQHVSFCVLMEINYFPSSSTEGIGVCNTHFKGLTVRFGEVFLFCNMFLNIGIFVFLCLCCYFCTFFNHFGWCYRFDSEGKCVKKICYGPKPYNFSTFWANLVHVCVYLISSWKCLKEMDTNYWFFLYYFRSLQLAPLSYYCAHCCALVSVQKFLFFFAAILDVVLFSCSQDSTHTHTHTHRFLHCSGFVTFIFKYINIICNVLCTFMARLHKQGI